MNYPEEVLTISKKGKTEVRNLLERGRYVKYNYLNPETGKPTENKEKIVLIKDSGEIEEYFIIPTKTKGRFLLIRTQTKENRKIWNGKSSENAW